MTYKSKLKPYYFTIKVTIDASSYERAVRQLDNMEKRARQVNQRIRFEAIR